MTEFFRHLGWPYGKLIADGMDPSVVSAHLEFGAPAFYDDVLDFHVACVHVGRSSFELTHEVRRAGQDIVTAAAPLLIGVMAFGETGTRSSLVGMRHGIVLFASCLDRLTARMGN